MNEIELKFPAQLQPLPPVRQGHSMRAEMRFGWRPQVQASQNPPIPLCFGLVHYNIQEVFRENLIIYIGPRH